MQIAVTGFITATLFLRTHLHPRNTAEGLLYQGALFYTLLVSPGCITPAPLNCQPFGTPPHSGMLILLVRHLSSACQWQFSRAWCSLQCLQMMCNLQYTLKSSWSTGKENLKTIRAAYHVLPCWRSLCSLADLQVQGLRAFPLALCCRTLSCFTVPGMYGPQVPWFFQAGTLCSMRSLANISRSYVSWCVPLYSRLLFPGAFRSFLCCAGHAAEWPI